MFHHEKDPIIAIGGMTVSTPSAGQVKPDAPEAPPAQNPPAEVPETPRVWDMPTTGMEWCDCGEHCEVTIDRVEEEFFDVLEDCPDWVTHRQLCRIIQYMWRYISVCQFFFDHVERSATAVVGGVKEKYEFLTAVDIAGYFTKTWNGCPEEACEGGLSWTDLD